MKNDILNCKLCDYIVVFSGVRVEINNVKPMFLSLYTERRPIGLRSPSDRIAFAVRLDCVRRLIGLRSPSDE